MAINFFDWHRYGEYWIFTFFASMFLIHFTAWHCGSIMRGQRVPRVTIMPFSVLNPSDGNPWIFQSLMVGGSTRNSFTSRFGDVGISLSCTWPFDEKNERFLHKKKVNFSTWKEKYKIQNSNIYITKVKHLSYFSLQWVIPVRNAIRIIYNLISSVIYVLYVKLAI